MINDYYIYDSYKIYEKINFQDINFLTDVDISYFE